ncbi:MAG: helix-turn-helix transcriptional regulator [Eubacterium sp.]|nr:helix-turn-helix transcriptional regulator [Eubacterium sp.]
MFNDNLKAIRKEKGYTQETLAIELNVVRQTVSKWEKGLSVPDAEMLQKISEVLDVSVNRLLGAEELPKEESRNELAEQLARINEQLAMKNRRARRIWRAVLIIPLVVIVLLAVAVTLGRVYTADNRVPAGKVAYTCTLDGETYGYEFEYNKNYQVIAAGGDGWISDHVDVQYDDVNQAVAHLKDYFKEHGGTVTLTEQTGIEINE